MTRPALRPIGGVWVRPEAVLALVPVPGRTLNGLKKVRVYLAGGNFVEAELGPEQSVDTVSGLIRDEVPS